MTFAQRLRDRVRRRAGDPVDRGVYRRADPEGWLLLHHGVSGRSA